MSKGFTFIEVLVAIVIAALVFFGIYGLFDFSLNVLGDDKARVGALAIANEKIAHIRNLPYTDVGTTGGIPSGKLPAFEELRRNNILYQISTNIIYIDDPFDGTLGGTPDDLVNNDYKKAKVTVGWHNRKGAQKEIQFLTDIAPLGIEPAITGGTLAISVFDANGLPVPQATVHIENDKINPVVKISMNSDADGKLILPGAPESQGGYRIAVEKSGYSKERTFGTEEVFYPLQPHASVVAEQATNIGFAIDKLSNLNVQIFEKKYKVIKWPTKIILTGAKLIGANPNPEPPPSTVPAQKFPATGFLVENGSIAISSLEWDTYFLEENAADYDLAESIPLLPINLLPDTTQDVRLTLAPHAENTLWVGVVDTAKAALADVKVRLQQAASGYDKTLTTSANGQVFFTPLQQGTYFLTATKDGFQSGEAEIAVEGQTKNLVTLSVQ